MRNNQQSKEAIAPVFKKTRKRIETLFAQLCDQFMLKRNYAKSVAGLTVRVLNKVAAVTCLQFLNNQNWSCNKKVDIWLSCNNLFV